MARKRTCPNQPNEHRPSKRVCTQRGSEDVTKQDSIPVLQSHHHAVLSSIYRKVCTLRSFLLAKLPTSSRVRRRRLHDFQTDDASSLLDSCLLGISEEPSASVLHTRKDDLATFTQTPHHATGAFTGKTPRCSMNEVVDFVIWSLFKNCRANLYRPRHILCHGFSKAAAPSVPDHSCAGSSFLPGIVRQHPNDSIDRLKAEPWSHIFSLLGEDAERILSDLLLDCGLFVRMSVGRDNYFQLSGIPIGELTHTRPDVPMVKSRPVDRLQQALEPSRIRFVRNRILYAKANLNRVGKVKFGLKQVHVLERCQNIAEPVRTVHILKYMFPRQYGLHNVFTSKVDPSETAQPFMDYAFREAEIAKHRKHSSTWIPKRLRGVICQVAAKMQRNHRACSYSQLLRHYCPLEGATRDWGKDLGPDEGLSSMPSSEKLMTQRIPSYSPVTSSKSVQADHDADLSFLPYSTPPCKVSSFCRSCIGHLLPKNALGEGPEGEHNLQTLLAKIDHFVRMRRFESLDLHQAMQGIRQGSIGWLSLPNDVKGQKVSRSDFSKRIELLQEFIYYIFDSILIPLIRANFYVTESSSHRNRLFYFRHDVWRKLSEPSLATWRVSMFVPIVPSQVRHALSTRSLGYSHLRLLPKDSGTRPITNLRRRQVKKSLGRRILGPSINAQLTPLFSVLNYELSQDSSLLGSALLSVGDIHEKMSTFKTSISPGSRVFFVKVDIKSCFDSIPQKHLLSAIRGIFRRSAYRTTKHAEFKSRINKQAGEDAQLHRRFVGSARPADGKAVFSELSTEQAASKKSHVVFSDTGNHRHWTLESLLKLLQSHVSESMVKVGKKHMIQKDGIPQGSILSSLLCSYFYGVFEREELDFLTAESCLLLRLIDDFLLMTTDQGLAKRFLEVMGQGDPKYGIQVNAGKSLVNFDVTIHGRKVPRVEGTTWFPYCGMHIEVNTLALRKAREKKDGYVDNSLTVETGAKAGALLRRRLLSSLKLQMHAMLLDTNLNSQAQVMSTLLANFYESAMKCHRYQGQLARAQRPSQGFLIRLIEEMITAAFKICLAKNSPAGRPGIEWSKVCWLGATAFQKVLQRKQSQYHEVLCWLDTLRTQSEARAKVRRSTGADLTQECEALFRGYVY